MGTDAGSIVIRILGVVAFLLGLYCIRTTYKLFKKLFYAKVVATLPIDSDDTVNFELTEPNRTYGIWLKGKWLKKAPATHFKPLIINNKTGKIISLRRALGGAHSNNMKNASVQLFWFKAEAGNYSFQKTGESSLSSIGTIFSKSLFPTQIQQFSLNDFSFELRKDLHPIYFLVLILSMLASFFCTLLGLFMFLGAEDFSVKFNLNF